MDHEELLVDFQGPQVSDYILWELFDIRGTQRIIIRLMGQGLPGTSSSIGYDKQMRWYVQIGLIFTTVF